MTPSEYLQLVKSRFQENGNPVVAQGQMAYMRHQFEFYGLKAGDWLPLTKQIIREHGIPEGEQLKSLVRRCFDDEYREVQFFAVEMVQSALKKQPEDFIDFLEELIVTKSWWDTVDWLSKLVGIHFRRYPELTRPVTERWMASGNIWLQRVSIIFQLAYREKTDTALLFDYILRVRHSREFFLRKGAGWALRQYSRTNPQAVVRFIEAHDLHSLTKREGLKWLRNRGML